jgi:hypothetical protein
MLGNYSKLIGSLVGGLFGMLVSFGIMPTEWATPEIQASIVTLLSAVFTFLFPANAKSA